MTLEVIGHLGHGFKNLYNERNIIRLKYLGVINSAKSKVHMKAIHMPVGGNINLGFLKSRNHKMYSKSKAIKFESIW